MLVELGTEKPVKGLLEEELVDNRKLQERKKKKELM